MTQVDINRIGNGLHQLFVGTVGEGKQVVELSTLNPPGRSSQVRRRK